MTQPSRRGFTLVEMLCVMMLLTVTLMVMALLLRETMRVERIQSTGFDRILQSKTLADLFRRDVALAEKEEQAWNGFKADDATLILRMKYEDHVVYRWEEGQLSRRMFQAGKAEQTAMVPLDSDNVEVQFLHATSKQTIRLRLHRLRDGKRDTGHALEFAAALGGDWR
jgi:prepilin-type N-terminal cleavage/methylation domain-containing protein